MPRKTIHRIATLLDDRFDAERNTPRGRIVVVPYRGFGRAGELFISGRVMVEKPITRATAAESLWRNLVNSYRRFHSEEIAGARVVAKYRESVVETVSDEEGHFRARLQPTQLAPELLWHEVNVELPDHKHGAIGHVIVPSEAAEFGIISDIDDTVVQTGATSLKSMVQSVLLANAATRLPFEGIAELYQGLHRDRNPIFYVSSSPWNLYDLLHDFLDLNHIPHGPLMLQDWGIDEDTLITTPHDTHKLEQIRTILEFYPSMKFLLVGDSGQRDPEIYHQVIQSHPGRVLAAIIRDVTLDVRDQAVARIAADVKSAGVEMLYVADSAAAFEHVKRLGLIAG